MMVLPLTSMAGFQMGSGVLEVVVLGNEVRRFQEVGVDVDVDKTMAVMIAMDGVGEHPDMTVAGLETLSHEETVKTTG